MKKSSVVLSPEQRERIRTHLEAFRKYMASDQFKRDQQERLERVHYFQKVLPPRLAALSEADVEELITKLWSSRFWGNKQYLVQLILSKNGLDRLRDELTHLVALDAPISERYSRFTKEVDRLGGPASLTEMLAYLHPDQCGIWNGKVRQALTVLNLDQLVDARKYRPTAAEYESFNQVLGAIADELRTQGVKDVDLLFVDFFLYEVAEDMSKEIVRVKDSSEEPSFDHDEIRDRLEQIGSSLGFDTDTEVKVAHGAVVDCVWRAKIGNLGLVTYCFEVQRGGSIDGLLMNLLRARNSPTVQKVFAVSDEAQLERIRKEAGSLPEEFRKALGFWPIGQAIQVSEQLAAAMEIINGLGLVQREF